MLMLFIAWLLQVILAEAENHTHWGIVSCSVCMKALKRVKKKERLLQGTASSSEREIFI